jgi:hypothetical protein
MKKPQSIIKKPRRIMKKATTRPLRIKPILRMDITYKPSTTQMKPRRSTLRSTPNTPNKLAGMRARLHKQNDRAIFLFM